jgi:hypothetical protein
MQEHEALRQAIRDLHGIDSTWIKSVPVHETFQGETVWDGVVEVFDLIDHPKANRCYAWSHATEGTKRRFYAVLELGPVKDAVTAVRAAIASDARRLLVRPVVTARCGLVVGDRDVEPVDRGDGGPLSRHGGQRVPGRAGDATSVVSPLMSRNGSSFLNVL